MKCRENAGILSVPITVATGKLGSRISPAGVCIKPAATYNCINKASEKCSKHKDNDQCHQLSCNNG